MVGVDEEEDIVTDGMFTVSVPRGVVTDGMVGVDEEEDIVFLLLGGKEALLLDGELGGGGVLIVLVLLLDPELQHPDELWDVWTGDPWILI